MNNGIVVAMVVGVGGMVSAETVVSGDTQFYPQSKVSEVDAKEKKESIASRLCLSSEDWLQHPHQMSPGN